MPNIEWNSENLLIITNMFVAITAIGLSGITYHASHLDDNRHEERMQMLANEREVIERLDGKNLFKKALEEAKDGKPFAEIAAEIDEDEKES